MNKNGTPSPLAFILQFDVPEPQQQHHHQQPQQQPQQQEAASKQQAAALPPLAQLGDQPSTSGAPPLKAADVITPQEEEFVEYRLTDFQVAALEAAFDRE